MTHLPDQFPTGIFYLYRSSTSDYKIQRSWCRDKTVSGERLGGFMVFGKTKDIVQIHLVKFLALCLSNLHDECADASRGATTRVPMTPS